MNQNTTEPESVATIELVGNVADAQPGASRYCGRCYGRQPNVSTTEWLTKFAPSYILALAQRKRPDASS